MTESNLDILITRIVDGVGAPADWDSLEALAATDASVWRELAQAQRAEQLLKGAVAEAVAVADRVDVPAHATIQAERSMMFRVRRAASWGGWAAAAVVTLAFFGKPTSTSKPQAADVASPIMSAADALKQYMDKGRQEGRVIGELPDHMVVESTPAQDGKGYEVVFVRQIVERQRVSDFYQPSYNEAGQLRPIPARMVLTGGKPPS